MRKIVLLSIALVIPFLTFAQAENPPTYIIEVNGKQYRVPGVPGNNVEPKDVGGETVYVQKPSVMSDPVKPTDSAAYKALMEKTQLLPTADPNLQMPRVERGPQLTEPVLRVPNMPPRQQLPRDRADALIPPQPPAPKNLQPTKCEYSSGLRGRIWTCKFIDLSTGKPFTKEFPEFNSWNHDGFSLPNPDFLAIDAFRKAYHPDLNSYSTVLPDVPIDMMTLRPASVPVFYPGKLMAQLNNGKPWNSITLERNKTVLMGDGKTPLPEEFFKMIPSRAPNERVPDAPGAMMFLFGDWAKKGYLKDENRALKVANLPIFVPMPFLPPRPVLVPGGNGGNPPLRQIIQGNANPGRLPAQSAPTGGFGQPTGGNGSSLSGGGLLGAITDEWSRLAVLGEVEWSAYVEIPIFKWGNGPSPVPPPGFTIDGKAYNMYFSLNGAAFALSFTDLNNDGIYEAHILELEGDPKSANLARVKQEFMNYDEFAREIARRLALSTPAKK